MWWRSPVSKTIARPLPAHCVAIRDEFDRALARLERRDFGVGVMWLQVWPPSKAIWLWRSGQFAKWSGYSNQAFTDARDKSDLAAAKAALAADPPAVIICIRER